MLCRSPSGGTAARRPLKPAAESHCIPRSFTTAQTVARRVVGTSAECIELRAGRMARLRQSSHHARLIVQEGPEEDVAEGEEVGSYSVR
jgi:hypothetical protein